MSSEPLRVAIENNTITLMLLKSFRKITLDFRTEQGEKFPWDEFIDKAIAVVQQDDEPMSQACDAAKVCFFLTQSKSILEGMTAQDLWETGFLLGCLFERVRKNRGITLNRIEEMISAQDIREQRERDDNPPPPEANADEPPPGDKTE